MSTERSIALKAPKVRALLNGATQLRVPVNPQPPSNYDCKFIEDGGDYGWWWSRSTSGEGTSQQDCMAFPKHNFGRPGDRLWVRETHTFANDKGDCIIYEADGAKHYVQDNGEWLRPEDMYRKRPSIHMPRWASRILLEVVSVRVERLQDISEEDAKAEGIEYNEQHDFYGSGYTSARYAFRDLWGSINGPGSWEANPWVWVVEFRRHSPTN